MHISYTLYGSPGYFNPYNLCMHPSGYLSRLSYPFYVTIGSHKLIKLKKNQNILSHKKIPKYLYT